MLFFEAPSLNVPVNRLMKWVVRTSPLKWNHEFFFSKFLFFSFLFLIIHPEIQTSISTLSSLTVLLESGLGSRASTCSVRRFLPFVFNTQFFPNRHSSDAHYSLKVATLSPATVPKCWAIKGVFLTSNYLHINFQPRDDFLFQECTQSEAAIYSRVMFCSIVLKIQK